MLRELRDDEIIRNGDISMNHNTCKQHILTNDMSITAKQAKNIWPHISFHRVEEPTMTVVDEPNHGRELGDNEIVKRGDIIYKSGDMFGEMHVVMGYEGKTVSYVKKQGNNKVMRPGTCHHDYDDVHVNNLEEALRWAWNNLLPISNDMGEIALQKEHAGYLIGEEVGSGSIAE